MSNGPEQHIETQTREQVKGYMDYYLNHKVTSVGKHINTIPVPLGGDQTKPTNAMVGALLVGHRATDLIKAGYKVDYINDSDPVAHEAWLTSIYNNSKDAQIAEDRNKKTPLLALYGLTALEHRLWGRGYNIPDRVIQSIVPTPFAAVNGSLTRIKAGKASDHDSHVGAMVNLSRIYRSEQYGPDQIARYLSEAKNGGKFKYFDQNTLRVVNYIISSDHSKRKMLLDTLKNNSDYRYQVHRDGSIEA